MPTEEQPTTQVFAADVDGDGASEIVCNNAVGAVNDIQVRDWSDATGLGAAETWKTSWCEGQLRGGDFDGDAKMDLLVDKLGTPVAFGGTTAVQADLIQLAATPLGARTTLAYGPTSAYSSVNNPPVHQVVKSLTLDSGRPPTSTWTYSYAGGLMDRAARKYLGFQYVRTTALCLDTETTCPYEEVWLLQDAVAGSPGRQARSACWGHAHPGATRRTS